MISTVSNLVSIKRFRVDYDHGKVYGDESDTTIFDHVRGHKEQYEELQRFVDTAVPGQPHRVGYKTITCVSVDQDAIQASIKVKQIEIENLEYMLMELQEHCGELPNDAGGDR